LSNLSETTKFDPELVTPPRCINFTQLRNKLSFQLLYDLEFLFNFREATYTVCYMDLPSKLDTYVLPLIVTSTQFQLRISPSSLSQMIPESRRGIFIPNRWILISEYHPHLVFLCTYSIIMIAGHIPQMQAIPCLEYFKFMRRLYKINKTTLGSSGSFVTETFTHKGK
jgi:hypothetical protein